MPHLAFIPVSIPLSRATCQPRRICHLRTSSFPTHVRSNSRPCPCRILAADKLYPDPLPPDSNEDPLKQAPIDADSLEAPPRNAASYLEQLNRAISNRDSSQDQPVPVTPLDPDAPNASDSRESSAPRTTHGSVLASVLAEEQEGKASQPPEQAAVSVPSQPSQPARVLKYGAAARALWRIGWATWWVQLILTVVSAVIVLFSFAYPSVDVGTSASALGVVLATIGLVIAFVSLVWTYSYTRLSLWLSAIGTEQDATMASSRISRRLRYGLLVALVGLTTSILGLQAIVGTLLSRLLSSGFAQTAFSSPHAPSAIATLIQPVDILVVQASANVIMALLVAVVSTLWFRGRADAWEEKARTSTVQ